MSEFKPGDVAVVVAPYSRFVGERVMRCVVEAGDEGRRAGWSAQSTDGLSMSFGDATLRPLVVIDPEDREQVERFVALYFAEYWKLLDAGQRTVLTGDTREPLASHHDAAQTALREFANPTPAKPDEPQGLGAVVEDDMGRHWVSAYRDGGSKWVGTNGPSPRDYADIPAVRILSEGITP